MPLTFFSQQAELRQKYAYLNRQVKAKTHCDFHLCIGLIFFFFFSFLFFFPPSNFMRQECLDSRFVFDRPLPVSRLVSLIGSSILFFFLYTCNISIAFYLSVKRFSYITA